MADRALKKAALEKGVQERLENEASVTMNNKLQRQSRYCANPEMSEEQATRAPFGSVIPLTSFSKISRFFKDQAYAQASAERRLQQTEQKKRLEKRQADWRESLLTELELMQNTSMTGGFKREALGQIELLRLSDQEARQGLVRKANPDSHKAYTQVANMAPNAPPSNKTHPTAALHIKSIENRVRESVLKEFLKGSKDISLDAEEVAAELENPRKFPDEYEENVRMAVCLLKLRSRTIVTKEMIRVLLYSLDTVVEVEKIFFTPIRDECYVKFLYNTAIANAGPGASQHNPIFAIQMLVDELTVENENPFFEATKAVTAQGQQHYMAIRNAIKTALKRTTVLATSWQQMHNIMQKYAQSSRSQPALGRQPQAQVYWPGPPPGPASPGSNNNRPRPAQRAQTQVVRAKPYSGVEAAHNRYGNPIARISTIPGGSAKDAKAAKVRKKRLMAENRRAYEQAMSSKPAMITQSEETRPKLSNYHPPQKEARLPDVPRHLAFTNGPATTVAGNLEWTLTRKLVQEDWESMVKHQNQSQQAASG